MALWAEASNMFEKATFKQVPSSIPGEDKYVMGEKLVALVLTRIVLVFSAAARVMMSLSRP